VRSAHTLIWFLVEAAMVYLVIAGIRKKSDRKAGVAAVIVAAETLVFLGNGARCPLTGLAESMGADSGSVTDIFLPRWFAHNLPVIHVPLIGTAVWLHWRNLTHRAEQNERDNLSFGR
jgi:hypothetical protein